MGAAFKNPPVSGTSARLFSRHARYSRFDRTNYSKQEIEFLDANATRLSVADSAIFAALKTYTADQIAAASAASDIGL